MTAPFATEAEQDEWVSLMLGLWRRKGAIRSAFRLPELAAYRVAPVGSGMPSMPAPAAVEQAEAVLAQIIECARHYHRQRVRPGDNPDPLEEDADGCLVEDAEMPF